MRLPQFGQLPSGLNRDEAALGYNAYSLLQTGADEWGRTLPISITSFGDQKLPGYVYTLIPFIAVLDLEIATVRLPSFLAGLLVMVGTGVLAIQVTRSIRWSPKQQLVSSFIVMVLIAISPWGMHFSRVAYEAHLALAAFITGLVSYWRAIDTVEKYHKMWLIVAALTWSLTLLTYHSYHIFLPLFLITLAVLDWHTIRKLDRTGLTSGIGIGVCTLLLLLGGGVLQANAVKNTGITPLSKNNLLNQATLFRQAANLPNSLEKLLFNKYGEAVVTLAQNYVTSISGTFFFVHGSNHGDHNPGNANNSNLLVAPFFAIGLLGLWQFKRVTKIATLFAWLLLGLVPASMTISPLHEVRMATIFPAMELFAGLGIMIFCMQIPKKYLKITVAVVALLLVLTGIRTYAQYLKISPTTAVKTTPYHVLARALAKYQTEGLPMVTQSPSSSPYIWYLFENKIDPIWLQRNRVAYDPTNEGFIHIKSIGNISFETINWDDIGERAKRSSLILFLKPTEVSDTQRTTEQWELLEILYDKNSPAYEVWKVSQL